MKIPLSLLIRQQVGRKVGLPFLEPGPAEVRLGCSDRNWTTGHWFPWWWCFKRMFRGIWWNTSREQSWRRACFASQGIYKHFPEAGETLQWPGHCQEGCKRELGKALRFFPTLQFNCFSPEVWVRTSLTQPSPSLSWRSRNSRLQMVTLKSREEGHQPQYHCPLEICPQETQALAKLARICWRRDKCRYWAY